MDVLIYTELPKVVQLLEYLGFRVEHCGNYVSATLRRGFGRYHALVTEIDNGVVYMDLHWDWLIHLVFIGVDYNKRPRGFFEKKIAPALEEAGIKYEITGGFNWWTRRNKAILRGMKVPY